MNKLRIFFYILVILLSSYYVYQHCEVTGRKGLVLNSNNKLIIPNESPHSPQPNINKLNNDSTILRTFTGDMIKFQDILCENYSVCYRCFESNCQSCILNTIWFLKDQLPELNLLIFASFPSENLDIFRHIYYSDQNVYNLHNNYLISQLDSSDTPYLLIIDQKLKIHGIIILHDNPTIKETDFIRKTINSLKNNQEQPNY